MPLVVTDAQNQAQEHVHAGADPVKVEQAEGFRGTVVLCVSYSHTVMYLC